LDEIDEGGVEATAESVQCGVSDEEGLEKSLRQVDGIAGTGCFIVALIFVSLVAQVSIGLCL